MKNQNAYSKVIAKAWSDPVFKKRLLLNPESVLSEQGIELNGKKIQLHENSDEVLHFILPKKPDKEMSITDIEGVAGACGSCSASSGHGSS